MLDAQALGCIRGGRRLFQDLSFTLNAGELLLVRGANGCGKTSLLRMLAGLLPIEDGALHWSAGQIPLLWLGHRVAVSADLTVWENLRYLATLEGDEKQLNVEALSQVGLARFVHTPAGRLSEGQMRRVALARLGFSSRRLWLLDEPMTALDASSMQWFEGRLAHHLEQGGSAVMATHREAPQSVPANTLEIRA